MTNEYTGDVQHQSNVLLRWKQGTDDSLLHSDIQVNWVCCTGQIPLGHLFAPWDKLLIIFRYPPQIHTALL